MTASDTSANMSWDAAPGIGFGCCPMGGHGWGKVDEQQLVDAVHTALDLGIQLFDTADVYGLGASETILGRALAGRRHEAVIATKFGVRYEHGKSRYDNSRTWILQAAEASLRRLHVDVIDLYQMHYWDGTTPLPEIVGTLQDLTVAGKIRAWGITNHSPTDAALSQSGLRCKTYSFQYSLVQRQAEREILAHQHAGRQVFLGWGGLGQGILSGKYQDLSQLDPTDRRHREVYANFHGDRFAAVQRLLAGMQTIAAEIGVATLSQLALRWVIDRIPRSIALVGIKRPEQIRDAAGSLDFRLEPAVLARLDALSADFESAPRQR